MAAGEQEPNKKERKGFAGLTSLVSDVDTSPSPPAKREGGSAAASSSAERRAALDKQQPESQSEQQRYQAPSQPSAGSSTGKWVLGVAAVIGVLWLIREAENGPSAPAPSYSPPARSAAPGDAAAMAQPQIPSSLDEERPPVGRDRVFSMAQIRYCLAEDIRMDAAKTSVNNYSDSDVDRFNVMVADYNSRCGSFRYRRGALGSARRDVEPYRSQLQAEGRSRFARSPSPGALSAPAASRPTANEMVRVVQQRLNDLGYNAGPADGLMGKRTRAAIIEFQKDQGLAATGAVDPALLLQLQKVPPGRTPERRPPDRLVPLSSAEQQSIDAACSTDKYVNGPAAYNQCLGNQLVAMPGQGARRPDSSSLSSPERESIEAACSTDNYVGEA